VVKSPYSAKLRPGEVSLWKSKTPLVATLEMELTERCNNNCIHCYINLPAEDHTAEEKELSTEEIKAILEEAASLGCLTVKFTGGEPLVREDFEEIYLSARKLGLKVVLLTNATLITPRLTRLFERTPPLEKIEITIYGMKKTSYESVTRVSGSFEAAWRGIDLLLDRRVPFVVKGVVLPSNRGEIEDFESWASSIPWMDRPPSSSVFLDLRCRRDSQQKNNLIKGMRLSPEDVLGLLTRRREEYLKEMREFCSKFTRPSGEGLFSCGAGVGGGCVDAYGNFQPCILLRHPDTVYDLKKGFLEGAIATFFPRIRQMKAENPDYLARCARCFLKGLCEQCPARSWMEHGNLDTRVEYCCEVTHAQARYLGLLAEGEMTWQVQDWGQRIKAFTGKEPISRERREISPRL
jgi:radical SAM protein with 4Fe4S-binding SPASM domain